MVAAADIDLRWTRDACENFFHYFIYKQYYSSLSAHVCSWTADHAMGKYIYIIHEWIILIILLYNNDKDNIIIISDKVVSELNIYFIYISLLIIIT